MASLMAVILSLLLAVNEWSSAKRINESSPVPPQTSFDNSLLIR